MIRTRAFVGLGCLLAMGQPASAQGVVSGVVFDSIARVPLELAVVQVVSASGTRFSRAVETDGAGRFTLSGLPNGRFTIGTLHRCSIPSGLDPPVRELVISRPEAIRVDLAIPSPARLRAAICK